MCYHVGRQNEYGAGSFLCLAYLCKWAWSDSLPLLSLDIRDRRKVLTTRMQKNLSDIINIASMQFARIPAGTFIMGSKADDPLAWEDEKPQHFFEIPSDYWMAYLPVTQADFQAFVEATGHIILAEQRGWGWVWQAETMQWDQVERVARPTRCYELDPGVCPGC